MALSELNKERLQSFKRNKRGYISFWIFSILFIVTLFSEILANDLPLLIRQNQKYYFPLFREYAETDFGGEFEMEADYRDPYVIELIEENGWSEFL